jgi:hypothetical protein
MRSTDPSKSDQKERKHFTNPIRPRVSIVVFVIVSVTNRVKPRVVIVVFIIVSITNRVKPRVLIAVFIIVSKCRSTNWVSHHVDDLKSNYENKNKWPLLSASSWTMPGCSESKHLDNFVNSVS